MSDKNKTNTITKISVNRQQALADGIFSVAMTLMVLQLTVPIVTGFDINSRLTQELLNMWPMLVSYFLSFFIVGMYWLIHHFIFDNIKYYDSTLAWLNILFLVFVSLIPFTTSLMGRYFLQKTPTIIYGFQLLIMFFMGFSLWSYATGKKNLVDSGVDISVIKGAKTMGYIYFIIMIFAIAFGFIMPLISVFIYGLIVVLFIIFTSMGKPEKVIIWSTNKKIQSK
jgi:uncharacterized membrane protein